MRRLVLGLFMVFGVALLPVAAHGQLAFTANDVTVLAGSTATVDFFVSDLDGSVGSIFGATYGLDIGDNESDTVPTGLTFSGLVTSGLFLSTAESPVAAGIGATYNTQVDFFNIPGLGAPVGISSTPQPVFSLEFEVGADVADGTVFVIDILGDGETSPNNIFSATDGQENEVGNVETGGGTITIVNNANVVPEPTAGVLLLVGGGLAALRRRKR